MPANYITWGNISGEYFYAGIGGERDAPLRARGRMITSRRQTFGGLGLGRW